MSSKQRVRAMDEETSAIITASYVVPDLVVAIQEAVYNSIEANAKSIKVAVDVARVSFSVTDDGDGIHSDEMYEHTFESIATSKANSSKEKYTHRGQFLVALGTLAKEVELESRVEDFWTSSRKLVQHSRIAFNAHSKTSRVTKGTYLRVDSLFWQLPVRQRELGSHASARSRIAKRLSSFYHSLSMIWPTLSIDVSYADPKIPRIGIIGVATCEERLRETFGDILGSEMEYVSFDTEDSPFTVRGYIAVIHDASGDHAGSLESPGWKQARSYYQFVFLDNAWMEDFQRDCCKTINLAAMQLEIGIPIFVLKISAKSHEFELHSDGETRVVNMKRPEVLTHTLQEFVKGLQWRIQETETDVPAAEDNKEGGSSADISLLKASPWIKPVFHAEGEALDWFFAGTDGEGSCTVERRTWEDSRNQPDYFTEERSEDDRCFDDGSYDDTEPALNEPGYAVKYAYHGHVAGHEYAREAEEPDMYEPSQYADDRYTQFYVNKRRSQGAPTHRCAHCTSCHRSQPVQILYVDRSTAEILTPRASYADEMSYAVQATVPQLAYGTDPLTYEFEFHDKSHREDVNSADRLSMTPPPTSTKPARTKQENGLDQLFFGTKALHRVTQEPKRQRAQSSVVRKLEPAFRDDDSCKPQSQWLSSRRLGREVAKSNEDALQMNISPPPKEKHHEAEDEDTGRGLHAGSDQLSEYFSFETLLTTKKQPTQSVIASFASKRAAIAAMSLPLPGESTFDVRVSHLPHDLHSTSSKTMTLDKSIFQTLEVIRQVDRKFILVKVALNCDGDTTGDADEGEKVLLLCIDQHAADERVRLEQLESQIFGAAGDEQNVSTSEHQPSLPVLLNHQERETLQFFEEEIRSWGFDFKIDEDIAWLTHTPKIDTRVATADDFREYLQFLSKSDPYVAHRVLRPPVITRFLHSRACRSAIMFGDYLSVSQCRDIIEQLSQCHLPFQCAHGRPSIVPLAELI